METDAAGYIVTEGKSSRTRVAGVFAAGDVQDPTLEKERLGWDRFCEGLTGFAEKL